MPPRILPTTTISSIKTQQLVSELLVLRACVRPRGKNNRVKPVRNLLRKIKEKLHPWPETSWQHLQFSPKKTIKYGLSK